MNEDKILNTVTANLVAYQSQIIDVANALGLEVAECLDGKFGTWASEAIEAMCDENARYREALEKIAFVTDANTAIGRVAREALEGGE